MCSMKINFGKNKNIERVTGGKGVKTLTLTGEELGMQEKLGYNSWQQHVGMISNIK